jgi:hypothetical protein
MVVTVLSANYMSSSGKLKLKKLSQILESIGVTDTPTSSLSPDQLADFLGLVNKATKSNVWTSTNQQNDHATNSTGINPVIAADDHDDHDIEQFLDDGVEYSTDDAVRDTFAEICGPNEQTMSLSTLLKWNEIQKLLKSGALKQDRWEEILRKENLEIGQVEQLIDLDGFTTILHEIDAAVDFPTFYSYLDSTESKIMDLDSRKLDENFDVDLGKQKTLVDLVDSFEKDQAEYEELLDESSIPMLKSMVGIAPLL